MGAPLSFKKHWKLLDVVSGILMLSVFAFVLLVYTPLGDSLASSGRQALALDYRSRGRMLRAIESGQPLEPCSQDLVDHMPCEDPKRMRHLSRERNLYRERHCPPRSERLLCLIPPPKEYKLPVPWPDSLHKVWFSNMPHSKIAERKGHQGWMKEQGSYFVFPGGGTMFTEGARQYIEKLGNHIPLSDGSVRTALDIGSGVASFGGYMLEKNILTLSFAPRDSHKAQIQFALERGIPAFVAMLGTHRLPFPAFAYDLVHCSRCLISFTSHNGSYFMEIDRLLRPGGFFVISGPPVQWPKQDKDWQDLQDLASNVCYETVSLEGSTVVWRKPQNASCIQNSGKSLLKICDTQDDLSSSWYVSLRACVSRFENEGIYVVPRWPSRLNRPPRRLSVLQHKDSSIMFEADSRRWERRVKHYKKALGERFNTGRFRNVMDMNPVFGGFAAAIIQDPVWVMNTVSPFGPKILPILFDRGLIGVTHDWCEAFSTYPRTYDVIHVANIDSLVTDAISKLKRCSLVDVVLEMDRILRPEGLAIFRDTPETLEKLVSISKAVRWTTTVFDTEAGSSGKEKVLVANKKFWLPSSL